VAVSAPAAAWGAAVFALAAVFDARGKTITFGQMVTTRMACPNMDFEQAFLTALTGNKLTYTIGEGNLWLTDGKDILMEFKKTD
jgi:heat shock protein HslJ